MKILQTIVIAIAVVVLLTGCVTSANTNRLSVGMTKQEVVSVLGEPESTAASSNAEVLRYHLSNPEVRYGEEEYFVRLVNSKVESYGKMGDFDSAKDPTLNLNIKNR